MAPMAPSLPHVLSAAVARRRPASYDGTAVAVVMVAVVEARVLREGYPCLPEHYHRVACGAARPVVPVLLAFDVKQLPYTHTHTHTHTHTRTHAQHTKRAREYWNGMTGRPWS